VKEKANGCMPMVIFLYIIFPSKGHEDNVLLELEDLGDDDIALRPQLEVIFNRSQVITLNTVCGPSARSSSPRSSSSLRYHEVSKQK